MQGRTFLRIMFQNIFANNVFSKTLLAFVNFCNEQSLFVQKELKFFSKKPLNNIEPNGISDNRFIFSTKNSGVKFK